MAGSVRTQVLNYVFAVCVCAAMAGVIFLDFGASSPGPLSAVHDTVEELRGSSGCEGCHGEDGQSLQQGCVRCHEEIGKQLDARAGIHGKLESKDVADCGNCHMEHRGASFDPAGDRAFVNAGLKKMLDFRHEGLDFTLDGKHDELACKECHEHAEDKILSEGCRRFLGLSQDCTTCHDDPHRGHLPKCEECHGQRRPFEEAALFDHDPRVPLTGSHAQLKCKQCHAADTPHSIEDVGAARVAGEIVRVRSCGECHESLHTQAVLRSVAAEARVPEDRTCEICHDYAHADFYSGDLELSRELHSHAGLPLTAPHDRADCTKCHEGIGAPPAKTADTAAEHARRFPDRDARACTSCHESSHTQAFIDNVSRIANTVPVRTCALCHGNEHGDFHGLELAANRRLHAASGFELAPPHDKAECRECHTGIGSPVSSGDTIEARYPGRGPQECATCHDDPHNGQFSKGPFAGSNCTACHDPLHFRPAAFAIRQHAKTKFALTGAHEAVGCRVCHEPPQPDALPVFNEAPTECAKCHVDVHDAYFEHQNAPKSNRGATGCARCHDTESFRLRKGQTFDHAKWTSFALEGKHAQTDCAKCHPATKPTHDGTRRFAKAPTTCGECHVDPHARQFEELGSTDCARCHTPRDGFENSIFDHNKHSRFKLDKFHAELECAKCHKTYTLRGGGKVVRYKPLGTKCGDCHGWKSAEDYEKQKERRKR